MSSAIGHCIAAVGIAETARASNGRLQTQWLSVLCIVACVPDVDYLFAASGISLSARVTHSVLIALMLPASIVVFSRLKRVETVKTRAAVALVVASLSHLIMDLLVGVTPLPMFWPMSHVEFSLPFGILPSAGALRLSNPYLYRNLAIELGVITPIVAGVFILKRSKRKMTALGCACLSVPFMIWAACLTR